MKRTMGLVITVMLVWATGLIFAAGSVPVGKAEDVGLSTERLRRISEAVDRHIKAGNVAGAVTLVARRGTIAHFVAKVQPVPLAECDARPAPKPQGCP